MARLGCSSHDEKMRALLVLLLSLLQLGSMVYGSAIHPLQSYLLVSARRAAKHRHREPSKPWTLTPGASASAPALPPMHQDSAISPSISNHHQSFPHVQSPSSFDLPEGQDCGRITCAGPLTTTPFGSPCACVLPMQVELDLGVAPFQVFSVVAELEVEVAAGIYMKQSQVRIMGAAAITEDQEKTRVDINLVPLGEKFDNMTAFITYERFWQKKVPINVSIFGHYEVIFVRYPGLPPSPPSGTVVSTRNGGFQDPLTAYLPLTTKRKLNETIIIIIAVSSFVLILMSIGPLIFFKLKKTSRPSSATDIAFAASVATRPGVRSVISSSLASSTSVSLVSIMATCPPSVKTFSLDELEKATNKFSSKKVLGEGGFGRVYHGIMEDGTEVAIKLLTREDHGGDREFIAEVEMLSRLNHCNLVKLLGICIEEHKRCLVYELVRNGSVESHLHGANKKQGSLPWDARMKIALGAARGLAYLHEDCNPSVIHRDFKASNVLLEDDFTPKVSDFGLAREASEGSEHISTRVMGTFGYVAPEYAMTGHLLVKSDVYSYGVVLLELLSGRKPVDYSQPRGQENLVTWARPLLTSREGLEQLVDPSLSGGYDFDSVAKVAAIASMCVHPEVSHRPFMGEVVQALKLMYNDTGETCEDSYSQREESSAPDCDFKGGDGDVPRLASGCSSPLVTMEYNSGLVEEMGCPHSASTLVEGRDEEPFSLQNRSGPLRAKRWTSSLSRLRGSMSEDELLSRRSGDGHSV